MLRKINALQFIISVFILYLISLTCPSLSLVLKLESGAKKHSMGELTKWRRVKEPNLFCLVKFYAGSK